MHTEMIQLDCDLVIEDINKIVLRAQRIMRVNLIGDSGGDWWGPCAGPEFSEECRDSLVMPAVDVGGKSGGGFAIPGPAPLGQPLWATLSTGPQRLLSLQQHLCGS